MQNYEKKLDFCEADDMQESETEIMRKFFVVLRNDFIRHISYKGKNAQKSLTRNETITLLYFISKIPRDAIYLPTIEFKMTEFGRVLGIDIYDGARYQRIKEAIASLAAKTVWLESEDRTEETMIHLISKAKLKKGNGTAIVELAEDIAPYLLNLRQHYCQSTFAELPCLTSKGIWLYLLLNSYLMRRTYATVVLDIEELKHFLDATSYDSISNFRKRVLIPAVDSINTFTPLKVEIRKEIKVGKKIKYIEFTILNLAKLDKLQELPIRNKAVNDYYAKAKSNDSNSQLIILQPDELQNEVIVEDEIPSAASDTDSDDWIWPLPKVEIEEDAEYIPLSDE